MVDSFGAKRPALVDLLWGASGTFDSDNRASGAGFAYDGNGSPTTYRGSSLAFDPEARATSLPSGVSAGYRADGLRAWKSSGGTRTYYLYDGGEPVVELDGSGSVKAYDVYAPDGLVARQVAPTPGRLGTSGLTDTVLGQTQYAFDPEGSVAQRLDSAGGVLSSSVYDAYGAESSTATPTDPFGYHARDGYVLDRETGLYLCQNRYYDPGTGRWATRDPIGYGGGINLYGYCASGPVGRAAFGFGPEIARGRSVSERTLRCSRGQSGGEGRKKEAGAVMGGGPTILLT